MNVFSICLCLLMLISAERSLADGYAADRSDAMKELIHRPRKLPSNWRERSGAVALNQEWEITRKGKWYVEQQREGGYWVQAGLVHGQEDSIAWGLKQLAWGFQQMADDGSFACDDAFHSASFLVETTARSILHLEASPYAARFAPELNALKQPLLRCAMWMISPQNYSSAEKQRIYTHRRFLLGCGLMQTAMIHRHERLRSVAAYFIQDGIRLQRRDGAFPEKGGHDSSYHAVSLIYLQRLIMISPEAWQDESSSDSLDRGIRWLCGRINAQGVVEVKGNTRTGLNQETGRSGKIKEVNLPEVATALLYYSHRTNDRKYESLARKVLGKE